MLIPYKLSSAITQLISNSDIFNHGCWCSKLVHHSRASLGGKTSVDELDEICKSWAKARRCLRSENQSCENFHFQKLSDFYEIENGSCLDNDQCLLDACEIDRYFVGAINNQNFTLNSNPNCAERTGGGGSASTNCEGLLASDLVEVQSTNIVDTTENVFSTVSETTLLTPNSQEPTTIPEQTTPNPNTTAPTGGIDLNSPLLSFEVRLFN